MNGLVRTAHRAVQNCVRNSNLSSTLMNRTQGPVKRDFTRGIWHMSCSKRFDGGDASSGLLHNHSNTCSCGCGIKGLHTKEDKNRESAVHAKAAVGERELVEFLTEEIVAERKAQKVKTLPQEVDGFKVEADDAEVVLSKQMKDELVRITFNVNHTVDSEEFDDDAAQTNKQEFSEMRSKPQFEVDLVRGDLTLGFTCSYLQEPPAAASADEYNDIFGIDEVTIYKGEWNDKVYAVAGDVLDGYLYDLLMNILEEKGVSNEFVQKLSDFSTAYEHSAYINLLENISKFTVGGKK